MIRHLRRAAERRARKISRRQLIGTALAVGAMGLAIPASVDAATYTVTNKKDSGTGSLRDAIAKANARVGVDNVVFASGLTGTIRLTSGTMEITDSVNIRGPGAAALKIDAGKTSQIFYIYSPNPANNNIAISGLTLMNGASDWGGAISCYGDNLTLAALTFANNAANGNGGAVAVYEGQVTARNCKFTGNVALEGYGGALYIDESTGPVIVDACSLNANSAYCSGGAICLYDQDFNVTITRTTIADNWAQWGYGGGVNMCPVDGAILVQDAVVSGNDAYYDGGGFYIDNIYAPITFNRCSIINNTSADDSGGGLLLSDTDEAVTLANCKITGNKAAYYGGGLYFYYAGDTLTITNCTISANSAEYGGGICLDYADRVTIVKSTIADNAALYGSGGGIAAWYWDSDDALVIDQSTISGNVASYDGGGMYVWYDEPHVLVQNTTIANNLAFDYGGGMMFDNASSGDVSFKFCTISGNTANWGGGMYISSDVNVANSIIANNTAWTGNPDISGGTFNLEYSLVEDDGTATINDIDGNIFDEDPMLSGLKNNGGPTLTMLPGVGSPVINAADPTFVAPPATDQRGLARIRLGRADMGAVERQY